MSMATEMLAIDTLERLVAAALERAGTTGVVSIAVARALVAAEVDGQKGHGLSRVASYAAQVRSGKIDGSAIPVARRTRPGTLTIDARYGFAYPALDLAVTELPAIAREAGIAAAGISRSHHAGALGLVAERLANEGLVALLFANTPSAMAPWGGRRGLLGTNPIAFATPRVDCPPLVVDLALSEVARGKILAAAQKREPIPAGWAVDKNGEPTTDAQAALKGTLKPAGGAKGAALALMVELLAAAVTGSNFASEASSFLDAEGAPPATGQLVVAIDASALGAGEGLARRIADFAVLIEAEPGARLPGSRRHALRAAARRDGIRVEAQTLATLKRLAEA
jgi:(2R)-3-sulfolactate dehydrogenase (NADP+)